MHSIFNRVNNFFNNVDEKLTTLFPFKMEKYQIFPVMFTDKFKNLLDDYIVNYAIKYIFYFLFIGFFLFEGSSFILNYAEHGLINSSTSSLPWEYLVDLLTLCNAAFLDFFFSFIKFVIDYFTYILNLLSETRLGYIDYFLHLPGVVYFVFLFVIYMTLLRDIHYCSFVGILLFLHFFIPFLFSYYLSYETVTAIYPSLLATFTLGLIVANFEKDEDINLVIVAGTILLFAVSPLAVFGFFVVYFLGKNNFYIPKKNDPYYKEWARLVFFILICAMWLVFLAAASSAVFPIIPLADLMKIMNILFVVSLCFTFFFYF